LLFEDVTNQLRLIPLQVKQ